MRRSQPELNWVDSGIFRGALQHRVKKSPKSLKAPHGVPTRAVSREIQQVFEIFGAVTAQQERSHVRKDASLHHRGPRLPFAGETGVALCRGRLRSIRARPTCSRTIVCLAKGPP
jgi:hypothetical protein